MDQWLNDDFAIAHLKNAVYINGWQNASRGDCDAVPMLEIISRKQIRRHVWIILDQWAEQLVWTEDLKEVDLFSGRINKEPKAVVLPIKPKKVYPKRQHKYGQVPEWRRQAKI
jgi:hypothetical protein